MTYGVRCPKCGLLQLAGPACKSCGTALGGPARRPAPSPVTRGDTGPTRAATAPARRVAPPTDLPGAESRRLTFAGSGGSLFGIQIVNIFLTVATLGIYYFWGKVRIRRYLMSQAEFAGDRFAYHGTGKELLVGWLKAFVVFGIPVGLLNLLANLRGLPLEVKIGAALLLYGAILVVVPFAMVAARRYRLSRTSWRGIRFSFRGRPVEFIRLFLGGALLSLVTLGLYYPVFATRQQAFMVSHTYFGTRLFAFDGRGRDLLAPFIVALLLVLPTLGLYWPWFTAKKQRYYWEHTAFAGARFRSTVTGGGLLLLGLGNLLLLVVTLGLAWPWVKVRSIRFVFRYLRLEGPLDLADIRQEAQPASATGEVLAGLLDAGFDLG